MTREEFRKRLEEKVLIADGASGTMLALQGVPIPYDLANLLHPELVKAVHRAYYTAQARLIETNTHGANRLKLLSLLERQGEARVPPEIVFSRLREVHQIEGLQEIGDLVRLINQAGVRLAREAVGPEAVVFGSVGPVGKPLEPMGPTRLDQARQALEEQIRWLIAEGVDGLVLETFTDLNELRVAYEVARRLAPDLPLIVSKAFIEDGETILEGLPERFAREVGSWEVDAVGANCVVGPQRMLDILRGLILGTDKPISVMPTPGLPQLVRGEVVYDIQPEYFAKYARRFVETGAWIVGGCCGTTPDHIRAIYEQLQLSRPASTSTAPKSRLGAPRAVQELPSAEPSRLASLIGVTRLLTVELDLPRGLKVERIVESAALLKAHGVHLIDISDGARARLRMNVIAISHLIQEQAGIEVMMHFACRDRNLLAIQSDLLGAHALGIRNILAITGDPAQIGDYPTATSVFDVDAIGLIRILRRFNEGYDLAANPIGMKTAFTIAAAFNPMVPDREQEVNRLKRKAEEGARLFYTQPIFDPAVAEWTAEVMTKLGLHWLLGVMPLRSARHAEFMHHEVPGIVVPEAIRKRMAEVPEADALPVGIEIAQNFLQKWADCADGIYLMPPGGNAQIALQVLEPFLPSKPS